MQDGAGQSATTRPRSRTRWDIQGLRAFAVLSVVLYHLWPNRLPGGFVGVDVFFVISGYLITGHLLRERESSGRVALGQFWSRRAKRLLPSAFLTLAAVGVAVLLLVPSSLWSQYAHELISSTLYVQNWQLAADSVNYLSEANQPSPFQHFWSLSVEEQFYIGLPLLVLATTIGASPRIRRRFGILLGVVVVLSFAWCVRETATAESVAYFSTASRAWEFALGGLASVIPLATKARPSARVTATIAAAVGVVLLLASLFVIRPSTPFPGAAAALPVVGAFLVVLFGGRTRLMTLGSIPPIAFVGRISYSLYLWHWPAIVLVPLVLRHELTTKDKLAILIGAVAVASFTTVVIEEPLRFSGFVKKLRPRRVAVFGLVSTALIVALGASTLTALGVQQRDAREFAANLAAGHVACFGAAADISSAHPCVNPKLADVRVPSAATASTDNANRPACWSNDTGAFNHCQLGPRTGYTKHFLAVGDSHNNMFIAAYAEIADRYHWRIDVAGHVGCYWTTAVQVAASSALETTCNEWKANATAYVRTHPDLSAVIVTHSSSNSRVIPANGQSTPDAVVDGLVDAWRAATGNRVPILAIRDDPHMETGVVECVGQMSGPTTSACDQPRSLAFTDFEGSSQAVARIGLARYIDLTPYYCTKTVCPAVIGGVLAYVDETHLTETFTKTLAQYLGPDIQSAMKSLGRT